MIEQLWKDRKNIQKIDLQRKVNGVNIAEIDSKQYDKFVKLVQYFVKHDQLEHAMILANKFPIFFINHIVDAIDTDRLQELVSIGLTPNQTDLLINYLIGNEDLDSLELIMSTYELHNYTFTQSQLGFAKLMYLASFEIPEGSPEITEQIFNFIKKNYDGRGVYVNEDHKQFCESLDTNSAVNGVKVYTSYPVSTIAGVRNIVPEHFTLDFLVNDFTQNKPVKKDIFQSAWYSKNKNEIEPFDFEWLQQSYDYLAKLDKRSQLALYGYSYNGDKYANLLLRSREDFVDYVENNILLQRDPLFDNYVSKYLENYFPMFFQLLDLIVQEGYSSSLLHENYSRINFLQDLSHKNLKEQYTIIINNLYKFKDEIFEKITREYIAVIDNLIKNAPQFSKDVVVFRGTRDKYYMSNSNQFVNSTFMSTTFVIEEAITFADEYSDCCIKRIVCPKGTPAINMMDISAYSYESEVLLGLNNTFKIIGEEKVVIPQSTAFSPAIRGEMVKMCLADQSRIKEVTTLQLMKN